MSSAAVYDALVTYLEGNGTTGDVRSTINGEQTNLMVVGSCAVARKSLGAAPRTANAFPVSVEIVPDEESVSRVIGPGWEEVDYPFLLRCYVRRKDLAKGNAQLNTVEDMARALVRRYRSVSNLSITATGATFVRSTASRVRIDDSPESAELARAVVRVVFTFTEAMASN